MNRSIRTLIRYEWKSFIRNRFQLLMLGIIFLFSLYAIYYGHSKIQAQRDTIAAVTAMEQEEFHRYKSSFQGVLGTLEEEQTHDIASRPAYAWYRHGYHAILQPHDYASLAIGQRDLFRYCYRLTGMSLHYQLFENELANPVSLLVGNFDLSFVLVYLFPLLIIAFCYGLFSIERENGTLPLLQIQSLGIRKIILVRLGFYFSVITGLGWLLSLIGFLVSGNPLKEDNLISAAVWLIGVLAYCSFWSGLMFLVISFRRGSSFNAITAAGCWLLILVVIPSVLNVIVTTKYPLSSTTLAGLARRTGLENEDDEEEAREVIMEFLAHRPELAESDSLIGDDLQPKAYAAFTSLKDINSQQAVDHYNAQVAKRNQWTSHYHWLSPAVGMQEVLSHAAHTDLNTFVCFQESLVDFHRDITDFYFTKLFWGKTIALEDYSHRPVFTMPRTSGRWSEVWLGLSKVFTATALVFLLGFIKMKGGAGL